MNVYIESNYVLEIAFQQEQSQGCERILELAERKAIELLIPAYSLVEPIEKIQRQRGKRLELQQRLDQESRELSRTRRYGTRLQDIQYLRSLIIQSNEDEFKAFLDVRSRILGVATVIPLNTGILLRASMNESKYDLTPQDAVVYESVISHLASSKRTESCFLNRNSRDFDNPDIVDELRKQECRMIPSFDDGLRFMNSVLGRM